MRSVPRLLAAVLLAGSLALVAGPAAAADGAGLTYDQWRTGRLVMGGLGLAVMAFFAFRAVRAWQARRRTTGDG